MPHTKTLTLKYKLHVRNPEPQTLNPKPKPQTPNPKPRKYTITL